MSNISNLNILVTGGTGFIGSHLVEELVNLKANVITTYLTINPHSYFLSRKLNNKVKMANLDICYFEKVYDLVTKFDIDLIFHLAAQPLVEVAYHNPRRTLYTNILGTVNLLESARLYPNVKGIIVASSDKAYGKILYSCHSDQAKGCTIRYVPKRVEESHSLSASPLAYARDPSTEFTQSAVEGLGMTHSVKYLESDPLQGDHPYEVSKSSADLIAYSYYKTYNVPVVVTRCGNVYGAGDLHFSRIIPGIMKALINKEVLQIRSNGRFVRDYLYVKDVTSGYLLLASHINKVKGEAFNFGSFESLSVLDLIKITERTLQKKIRYKITNTAVNEIPYQSLDFSKIERLLKWKPEYKLEDVLPKIYSWYRIHIKK